MQPLACQLHPVKPTLRRNGIFLIVLLPIIILVTAWADSIRFQSSWRKSWSGEDLLVLKLDSSTFEIRDSFVAKTSSRGLFDGQLRGRFSRSLLKGTGHGPWFPPFHGEYESLPGRKLNSTVIPLWLILACYVPLWVGISLWLSQRKSKRIARSLPATR